MNFANVIVWYMMYAVLWSVILIIGMFIYPRILNIAGYGYKALFLLAIWSELSREEREEK